jgi:hypothetical protein
MLCCNFFHRWRCKPAANPTFGSYNSRAVNIYNAMSSLARFDNNSGYFLLISYNTLAYYIQRWRCSCKFRIGSRSRRICSRSRRIGSRSRKIGSRNRRIGSRRIFLQLCLHAIRVKSVSRILSQGAIFNFAAAGERTVQCVI